MSYWFLIIFYVGSGGVVSINMDSKDACIAATGEIKDLGRYAYCLNKHTGEVVK